MKDVSELYLADPDRFPARFQATLDAAVPWSEAAQAEALARAADAWVVCEPLAEAPRILERVVEALQGLGVAGEERAGKLTYLVVTSRLLDRPISEAAKGPSAGGKSFVVERVLQLFPPSAAYILSAMSEHALAYSTEPLRHRVLVIYEAAGLQSDFASYLVRSLLSEGRVRYETVEKNAAGLLQARLIEREGPTGLIVTTTRIVLHPENETRLLSVPITDTPEQTRRVLRTLARGGEGCDVDLAMWHALQTWLDGAEHRVVIPYAETLAEMIPPVAVRLRRDFGMLLSLIRSYTILHQATRGKDPQGQIVATLDDYAAVRELVADLLAEGIEASVSLIVRETVEAVRRLTEVRPGATATVKQVARELGIDSPPALRRVRMAIERGYLKNEETRKGRPAQLVLGDPLPEDVVILPPADDPRLAEFTVTSETSKIGEPPSPEGDLDEVGDDSWPAEYSVARDPEFVPTSAGNADSRVENDWLDSADTVPDSALWAELSLIEPEPLGWRPGASE